MAFLTSYFSGDINETHGLPLNVRPVSPPHIYQHLLRDYRLSDSHGDYRVSLLGRDGFKQCIGPKREGFGVVDMKDVGGTRYTLRHNSDKTVGYLQKQCLDQCSIGCKNVTKGCCGGVVNDFGVPVLTEFEITKCSSEDIFCTKVPKSRKNCYPSAGLTSDDRPVEIGNKIIGNQIFGYVCIDGVTTQDNLNCYFVPGRGFNPGSPLGALDCDSDSGYLGQVKELVSIQDGCYLTDTPWQGIDVNLSLFDLQDIAADITNIGNTQITTTQGFIEYVNNYNDSANTEIVQSTMTPGCIYCDYTNGAVISTSSGIFYDQSEDCDELPHLTPYGNTCQNFAQISNIFEMDGQVGYINSRTGYAFFAGFGLNNGYFTAANSLYVGEDFDVAFNFGGVLMLLSPERAGYIYRTGETLNGLPGVGFENLGDFGYLTPCSWDNHLENGYLIGNDNELYALSINYTGDNIFGGPRYRPQFTNISRYIRDRLKSIDVCKGDKVCLHVDGQHIRIFIGNNSGRVINGEFVSNTGSIILNFERYEGHQFWHIWTVCNAKICSQYKDCFYGDGVYHLEGCLDGVSLNEITEPGQGTIGFEEVGGEPFKQCVGMHVIDNPAGGTNSGIFSELYFEQLALIIGDEHMEGTSITVEDVDGNEEEFKGRTWLRTRTTHCGKEEVENTLLGDECFFCDQDRQLYKEAIDIITIEPEDILEASQETMLDDVFNIGRSNKDKYFQYCDIPDLCGDEQFLCEIKTCFEETDCSCEDLEKAFDTSKYWRYARRGILTKSIKKTGNHMYYEVNCDGGDRLHLVAMGVEISDEVKGFLTCECNAISKIPATLNEACKSVLHTNTSAKE